MVFTASLLSARYLWEVVENKPASSLVVSLGKALIGTPHLCVEDGWPSFPSEKRLVAGRVSECKTNAML